MQTEGNLQPCLLQARVLSAGSWELVGAEQWRRECKGAVLIVFFPFVSPLPTGQNELIAGRVCLPPPQKAPP